MMMQKKVESYFYLKSVQKGNFSGKREDFSIWTKRACGHKDMGTGSHQVWAAILTLFQPGPRGADYALHILISPPSFGSHRRAGGHSY